MKKILSIVLGLGFLLLAASFSYAHLGEDFFAVQVPIDGTVGILPNTQRLVHDGDPSEWANVDPAFWITHEDLVENQNEQGVNAADLAERIIIGWSPITNKVYWFEDRFDDVYVGWAKDSPQESVELGIDADHSGGQYMRMQTVDLDGDRWNGSHAQNYRYFVIREDPVWHWGNATWVNVAPYAAFGWSFDGDLGDPGTLIVEMGVTVFDDLDPAGIETSVVHQFTQEDGENNAVMGIGFQVQDADNLERCCGMVTSGGGNYTSNGGSTTLNQNTDFFNDFIMLSFDPDQWVTVTAVESDTWGRIKSSFNKN